MMMYLVPLLDVEWSIRIRSGVSSGTPGTAVLSGDDIIGGEKDGEIGGVIGDTVVVVMTAVLLNGGPIPSEKFPPASIINIDATPDVEVTGVGVITIGTDSLNFEVVGVGVAVVGTDVPSVDVTVVAGSVMVVDAGVTVIAGSVMVVGAGVTVVAGSAMAVGAGVAEVAGSVMVVAVLV